MSDRLDLCYLRLPRQCPHLGCQRSLGRLPRLLLIRFNIQQRQPSRIRSHRRPLHLPSSDGHTLRRHVQREIWHKNDTDDRHSTRSNIDADDLLRNPSLAPLPESRSLFRLGYGLSLHHRGSYPSQVVFQTTQSRRRHRILRSRFRWTGIQFRCRRRIGDSDGDGPIASWPLAHYSSTSPAPLSSKTETDLNVLVQRLLIAWGIITELGYIVLLYSLPNYAQTIGLSARQGSVVGAMLSLGLGFGRPLVGWLSDNYGRINIATGMTALCGIFCLAIWVPASSYGVLILLAVTVGTAVGTFWGTIIPVTAEITDMQRLPSTFGVICLPLVLPTTFAKGMALELVAARGYLSAQIFTGCMFLAGASATWLLRSWQIHQMEKREEGGRPISAVWLAVDGLLQLKKVYTLVPRAY